ncbi:PREDICTED: tissue alpha-L-fucosidase-like isoform X1 [Papilio xuthus]|uniref:Putative alpha-L-fucosidase n=2 Tax=Papilio xuthus TaxID=66420 RepID=A0AAJ6ZZB3_PAPXU
MKILLLCILVLCSVVSSYSTVESGESRHISGHLVSKKYSPDWKDLDTRPLPHWYDDAKIGIFLHWGVYSVIGFSEWFWSNWKGGDKKISKFMKEHYPPDFTYQDFAPMFKAEFFDPSEWADLFLKSGARYIVLTSKHHDGFTMFPSHRSYSWNSYEVGPKRDIVGELSTAVRAAGLKFGVYHSLYEWFNPIYEEDKKNNFTTRYYAETKLWPDLKQLINDYKPSVLWSDGDWETYDTYWRSTDFLAWLYNESPVKDEIVVNDRWGIGIPCKHGDFYNCADRYNPGSLQNHKWENAFTVDSRSWGFRKPMTLNDTLSTNQILYQVVSTISCGGNALINVGPTQDGTISPIFQERLLDLGNWLKINGEAIYSTSPWLHQNDSLNQDVWYTCRKVKHSHRHPTAIPRDNDNVTAIYAIFLKWPTTNILLLKDLSTYLHNGVYKIELLGNEGLINWNIKNGVTSIELPDKAKVHSENAWTLKMSLK